MNCVTCGHAARADKVAAINIARKGKVALAALISTSGAIAAT